MINATKNSNFLPMPKSVSSLSGGGCIIPIIKTMMIAKKAHPVKIIIKTAIQPAYFCFFPRTARNMCPPSSWPAGRRLIDVIRRPTHPANAVKLKLIGVS